MWQKFLIHMTFRYLVFKINKQTFLVKIEEYGHTSHHSSIMKFQHTILRMSRKERDFDKERSFDNERNKALVYHFGQKYAYDVGHVAKVYYIYDILKFGF